MADVAELHQEARELPVRQQSELISQQFAIACHLPQHRCHRPPDDRPERRRSLIGRLKPNIQQYLAEGTLSNTSYKLAISSIHQDVVRTVIERSSSKLLNGRPPSINTAEQTLSRKTRTILAQLRTGHSESLVNACIESTRQRATIATTVVSRLMTPTTFSTALRSRPH